jgi:hypothetical protein
MDAITVTAVHLIAFLATGALPAFWLVQRKIIPKHYALIATIGVSGVVAYALFFIYALSPGAGTVVSGIYYLAGLVCALILAIRIGKDRKFRKLFIGCWLPPLIIMIAATATYSTVVMSCHSRNVPAKTSFNIYQSCLLRDAPGDDVLPEFFADNLIHNNDHRLSGDWKLADRPPLQIGNVISLLDIIPDNASRIAAYQIFSTFLQLSWIAALWALLKQLKLSVSTERLVLILSAASGFYFYNSIYVWPKLYSASFMIAAIGLALYDRKRPANTKTTAVMFSLVVLSLLAHGGVLFSLLPLAFILLLPKYSPGFVSLSLGLIFGLLLYSPWLVYKAQTTSSDRLVKWHLAGVIKPDNRGTLKTIRDSYSSLTFDEWFSGRETNIKSLFRKNTPIPTTKIAYDANSTLGKERDKEFYVTFPAFGLLNIGWIVIVWQYAKRKSSDLLKKLQPLLIFALASLLIWSLLMFIPGSDVIHQGSYATMMLIFTILICAINLLPRFIKWVVIALQLALFSIIWVLGVYRQNTNSMALAILLLIAGGLTISAACLWATRLASNSHS